MSITIDDIRSAADALASQVIRTPSIDSRILSELCGTEIVLKLENMQITGSFKPRGAYMKLTSLSDDERAADVVVASAGNHAQGVAYHADRLGIPATVYMPESTPFTKVARTEALGAHVELCGETVAEARQFAMKVAEREDMIFVHPYDDELVVTGQGTVGLELLSDVPDLDAHGRAGRRRRRAGRFGNRRQGTETRYRHRWCRGFRVSLHVAGPEGRDAWRWRCHHRRRHRHQGAGHRNSTDHRGVGL